MHGSAPVYGTRKYKCSMMRGMLFETIGNEEAVRMSFGTFVSLLQEGSWKLGLTLRSKPTDNNADQADEAEIRR